MNKKTLGFCGCSITEGAGLQNKQLDRYSQLVSTSLGFDNENYASNGASNHEIFLQAIQSINDNDITLVQWSSPGRAKFYHYADYWSYSKSTSSSHPLIPAKKYSVFSNVFLILDGDYNQYHYVSQYVKLLNIISLNLGKKVFFINGLMYIDPVFLTKTENINFAELNDKTKDILNFENLPDEDIVKNLNTIREYLQVIDSNWINSEKNLLAMQTDIGTDNIHPGPLSHIKYADLILEFFNKIEI